MKYLEPVVAVLIGMLLLGPIGGLLGILVWILLRGKTAI